MIVRVNPVACQGHALCAELVPEIIRLDSWGYPMIEVARIPADLESLVARAADACPTLALVIQDE